MAEPIPPQRLAEITACEHETRPGPWILADANDGDGTPPMWVVATSEAENDDCDWAVRIHVGDKRVGEFIAMARTAVPKLLGEVDRLTAELDEVTDLDKSALKTQQLHDERDRAVRGWHEQKKRADAAEARVAELEGERDEARWTACYYRNAWRAQDELAELSLGLLPDWVTDDGADNAPQPAAAPDRAEGSET